MEASLLQGWTPPPLASWHPGVGTRCSLRQQPDSRPIHRPGRRRKHPALRPSHRADSAHAHTQVHTYPNRDTPPHPPGVGREKSPNPRIETPTGALPSPSPLPISANTHRARLESCGARTRAGQGHTLHTGWVKEPSVSEIPGLLMQLLARPPLPALTHSRAPAPSHTHEGCTPHPRLLLLSLYLAGERAPKERTPRGAGSSLAAAL